MAPVPWNPELGRSQMAEPLKKILLELIQRLDRISGEFEFITDSVVRDKLSDFMQDFYLRRIGPLPKKYDFATNSEVVDGLLLQALSAYVSEANQISDERHFYIDDRLAAFQDDDVRNSLGRSYDEYFGYWRPGSFMAQ
jgi:hypothetical protein